VSSTIQNNGNHLAPRVSILNAARPKIWAGGRLPTEKCHCGLFNRYVIVGGLLQTEKCHCGLFNRYVIVGISEVFGHNQADLQSVTPALAHDPPVNHSTAPRPKHRGFKFDKNSRKGCDRFEKKRLGYL
jgi:hypothetical protein